MKKYFLGLSAFVLALGLSSFTTGSSLPKKPLASLYWYTIVSGNYGARQNSSPLTKTQAMTAPTAITPCNDDPQQPLCLVGSPSASASGTVGSPDFDHSIRKNP